MDGTWQQVEPIDGFDGPAFRKGDHVVASTWTRQIAVPYLTWSLHRLKEDGSLVQVSPSCWCCMVHDRRLNDHHIRPALAAAEASIARHPQP